MWILRVTRSITVLLPFSYLTLWLRTYRTMRISLSSLPLIPPRIFFFSTLCSKMIMLTLPSCAVAAFCDTLTDHSCIAISQHFIIQLLVMPDLQMSLGCSARCRLGVHGPIKLHGFGFILRLSVELFLVARCHTWLCLLIKSRTIFISD